MKFPKPKKQNYYRYLCGVAEEMNESFRYEGSNSKAIVKRIDGKLKIVILKEIR